MCHHDYWQTNGIQKGHDTQSRKNQIVIAICQELLTYLLTVVLGYE